MITVTRHGVDCALLLPITEAHVVFNSAWCFALFLLSVFGNPSLTVSHHSHNSPYAVSTPLASSLYLPLRTTWQPSQSSGWSRSCRRRLRAHSTSPYPLHIETTPPDLTPSDTPRVLISHSRCRSGRSTSSEWCYG